MAAQVEIFDTVEELAQHFASLLALHILGTPDEGAFSWMLSGGSAPRFLFRQISEKYRDSIDWNRVKVFWGDERCVPPGDYESNFKMAFENLLDHVPIPLTNIFRIQGEASPSAEAKRYGELFRINLGPDQLFPRADLVMLGIGEDGHTASIFPGNLDLFRSAALFETAVHPATGQKRITATGMVINHAKVVIMVVTGSSKASRVAQIINRQNGWDQLPAAFVRPEGGKFLWLLDKPAASQLTVNNIK